MFELINSYLYIYNLFINKKLNMRKLFCLSIAFFLISCVSNKSRSDYGKVIENYLQTDENGSTYDLKFKVIDMAEQEPITVADSIAYLSDEFKRKTQLVIDRIELAKKMSKELREREKNQSKIDEYKAKIAAMDARIDSLKNLPPDNLGGYHHKNSEDILALVIRCRYSITPSDGITVEETFDFFLSPDGQKCYGKQRAPTK